MGILQKSQKNTYFLVAYVHKKVSAIVEKFRGSIKKLLLTTFLYSSERQTDLTRS